MSFFNELKRRNVLRVGAAYIVGAWLLIQVTETIFPLFGFDDTPARVVVIVLAIAFVPVLIFAWVFELTPEGLKKDGEVDRSKSVSTYTGKKLDRIIMVVLALALGYFAIDKFVLDPNRDFEKVISARQEGRTEALIESYGEKSIAVLAFQDMSQDKDQEYLSDGIAEELLNLLARIPELRVISRSSAFSYKGKDIKLAQVAEELNVANILEGSVRKSGNRVRITAQLIEARSDTHLWSQTYDRTLDDIFSIQDEIAATVVEQLRIKLLGDTPKARETNPEAYALYLQARHLAGRLTAEGMELAKTNYQHALELDPDFTAAWNGLASIYFNLTGFGGMPAAEGYALALEATSKALAIDPDDARAHANLGWVAMEYDNDWVAAARHFMNALELEPANASIIGSAAALMEKLGRAEQAISLYEFDTNRDPLGATGYINLGGSYLTAGRLDEGIAAMKTGLRLSPSYFWVHYTISMALLMKGEAQAALENMPQEEMHPIFELYRQVLHVMAFHDLGRVEESDEVLAKLISEHEQDQAYNIAYVLAYRNETDRAFEWLEKAVENNDPSLEIIVSDMAEPVCPNICTDPRWLPFLESIGKSPAQLGTIKFEVSLPK